jgi:2-oxoisovalerate dehydrogenase E1 component alpha subunit
VRAGARRPAGRLVYQHPEQCWVPAVAAGTGCPSKPSARLTGPPAPEEGLLAWTLYHDPVAGRRRRAGEPVAPEGLLRAYRWMLLARALDETMWHLRRQGKGHFAVPCAGHEAVGAAAGLAADPARDYLAPHYRDLSACLGWGLSARDVMAHYYGRAADPCSGGRQPYAHWGSAARRILTQEGPQPNIVTHAVGLAYAARLLGEDAVVWIGFGDGGAQKGEVHEAMNFAAIHRLPVVFCVETNLYTQSVPIALESSVEDLSVRAQGYGLPGASVDGMDVTQVYAAARTAVERARAGQGPTLLEARTYRYLPNTSNDDDARYRPRDEVDHWRERDPLTVGRGRVLEAGAATAAELDALGGAIAQEVAEAAAWAEQQPDPEPRQILQHTWADLQVIKEMSRLGR